MPILDELGGLQDILKQCSNLVLLVIQGIEGLYCGETNENAGGLPIRSGILADSPRLDTTSDQPVERGIDCASETVPCIHVLDSEPIRYGDPRFDVAYRKSIEPRDEQTTASREWLDGPD